ncbi:MAG: hypothetical protein ACI9FN_002541 [Saprospiraceae bacterium]|jgi:hypothetical protein
MTKNNSLAAIYFSLFYSQSYSYEKKKELRSDHQAEILVNQPNSEITSTYKLYNETSFKIMLRCKLVKLNMGKLVFHFTIAKLQHQNISYFVC